MTGPTTQNKLMKISMVVEKWSEDQNEQRSPVQRINGFPFCLRLSKKEGITRQLSLICLMSREAELWECDLRIFLPVIANNTFSLNSWENHNEIPLGDVPFTIGVQVDAMIELDGDAKKWTLSPFSSGSPDVYLVIGDRKKIIQANKESLASQSPYFSSLFFGGFKEENMNLIPINDVGYQEFLNIINLVYRIDGGSVTNHNVVRILELADRFQLKIVQDIAVSFLLSDSCTISLHMKLLVSDLYNIPLLKPKVFNQYDSVKEKELINWPKWRSISGKTIRNLLTTIHSKNRIG